MATLGTLPLPSIPSAPLTPRRTSFTPPPAELSRFLAIPQEPQSPSVDACGKQFYMEMDWTDHGHPSSER